MTRQVRNDKKVVLFVAYGSGHINMLLPLIKSLIKAQDHTVVVLALTTAKFTLETHGIPSLGFKDLLLVDEDSDALEWGRELTCKLGPNVLIDEEESIAYLGLSYKDLVSKHGEIEAAALYKAQGRAAFLPMTAVKRVFSIIKPDLLVTTNSPRAEKAAILTAKGQNIPSVCLMDLFDKREISDRLGKTGYASKICVFSNTVKELLINSGRLDIEIEVTGNPDFDCLSSGALREKSEIFRFSNKLPAERVVLWARHAGMPNFELNAMIDVEVINIAKKNKDFFFIIRPHPNEPKEFNSLPDNVFLSTKDNDLHDVLLCSDLVLTIASTVGLQAVSCRIPLITFDMGPTFKYTPYSKMGLSIGISDLGLLENTIRHVFANGYECTTTVPKIGSATDNVLKVLREYL